MAEYEIYRDQISSNPKLRPTGGACGRCSKFEPSLVHDLAAGGPGDGEHAVHPFRNRHYSIAEFYGDDADRTSRLMVSAPEMLEALAGVYFRLLTLNDGVASDSAADAQIAGAWTVVSELFERMDDLTVAGAMADVAPALKRPL